MIVIKALYESGTIRKGYCMSKRISFADIAVNAAFVLMSAAAAVLLCIYFFGGRGTDGDPSAADDPHVINASETEPTQTFVTTVTETTVISEEAETSSETVTVPDIEDYSPAFFQNTLFIGDSISVGLINYEFLPPENVFAKAGITPSSVVNTNIDDVSVFAKAAALDPEYICIMLGTNSVAYVEGQQMAEELGDFIDMIANTCPNARIALASVPPVTRKHEEEKPEQLEAIIAYNKLVKALAEEKSVAYADTFSLLADETGYLGSRYAEHDGLHLKIHAYPVILGALQNAITDYYSIIFVPPAETETSSEAAMSVAGTVSEGTEAPPEADTSLEAVTSLEFESVGGTFADTEEMPGQTNIDDIEELDELEAVESED